MLLTCSDMDHTVLLANYTIYAFTASCRASPPLGRYSLHLPTGDGQAELICHCLLHMVDSCVSVSSCRRRPRLVCLSANISISGWCLD